MIKDYWPAENHDPEDEIYQKILYDIKDTDEKEIFIKSTLTPIASERVKVGGFDEHTKDTILRGEAPAGICELELSNEKYRSKKKPKKSRTVSWKDSQIEVREAVRKMDANRLDELIYRRHYRIVYKEYATPFYKLRTIGEMLLVLEHSIKGKLGMLIS